MAPSKRDLRTDYLSIITRAVDELVKRDPLSGLEGIIDATGYLFNRTSGTSVELGAAALALARVIPLEHLRNTAEIAAFERVYSRPNGSRTRSPSAAMNERYARASRAGAAARRGVDLELVRGVA